MTNYMKLLNYISININTLTLIHSNLPTFKKKAVHSLTPLLGTPPPYQILNMSSCPFRCRVRYVALPGCMHACKWQVAGG
jgi:hypothetical protein